MNKIQIANVIRDLEVLRDNPPEQHNVPYEAPAIYLRGRRDILTNLIRHFEDMLPEEKSHPLNTGVSGEQHE